MIDRRLAALAGLAVAALLAFAVFAGRHEAGGRATDTGPTGPPPTARAVAFSTAPTASASTVPVTAGINRPVTSTVDRSVVIDDGPPPASSAEEVAATVVATGWTWRFDDPPGRLQHTWDTLATPDTIDRWSPPPAELDRRRTAGEISSTTVTTTTTTEVATAIVVGGSVRVRVTAQRIVSDNDRSPEFSTLTVDVELVVAGDGWLATGVDVVG